MVPCRKQAHIYRLARLQRSTSSVQVSRSPAQAVREYRSQMERELHLQFIDEMIQRGLVEFDLRRTERDTL